MYFDFHKSKTIHRIIATLSFGEVGKTKNKYQLTEAAHLYPWMDSETTWFNLARIPQGFLQPCPCWTGFPTLMGSIILTLKTKILSCKEREKKKRHTPKNPKNATVSLQVLVAEQFDVSTCLTTLAAQAGYARQQSQCIQLTPSSPRKGTESQSSLSP